MDDDRLTAWPPCCDGDLARTQRQGLLRTRSAGAQPASSPPVASPRQHGNTNKGTAGIVRHGADDGETGSGRGCAWEKGEVAMVHKACWTVDFRVLRAGPRCGSTTGRAATLGRTPAVGSFERAGYSAASVPASQEACRKAPLSALRS